MGSGDTNASAYFLLSCIWGVTFCLSWIAASAMKPTTTRWILTIALLWTLFGYVACGFLELSLGGSAVLGRSEGGCYFVRIPKGIFMLIEVSAEGFYAMMTLELSVLVASAMVAGVVVEDWFDV